MPIDIYASLAYPLGTMKPKNLNSKLKIALRVKYPDVFEDVLSIADDPEKLQACVDVLRENFKTHDEAAQEVKVSLRQYLNARNSI